MAQSAAIDFLNVPTVTICVLHWLVGFCHKLRLAVHFDVTAHASDEWMARQFTDRA